MLNSYQTRLIFQRNLTVDVVRLRFQPITTPKLSFIAGQYVIMEIPQTNLPPVKRLYSIASPDDQIEYFDLLIKLMPEGAASSYLRLLMIGDLVNFQGPAGQFRLHDDKKPKIFLATGTGIAPMLSMIDKLVNPKFKIQNPNQIQNSNEQNNKPLESLNFEIGIFFYWGLATFQDVFYLDQLKQTKKENPNFDFKICLSREPDLSKIPLTEQSFFSVGHIDVCLDALRVANYELRNCDFYLCGRREMVEETRRQLLEKYQVPNQQIYFERF